VTRASTWTCRSSSSAEQTGIPRSAISDIERGERRVESLELKRLAELYGVTVSYLLDDEAADGETTVATRLTLFRQTLVWMIVGGYGALIACARDNAAPATTRPSAA
jgi:transcriptional regulator with XRE-family HTH domain